MCVCVHFYAVERRAVSFVFFFVSCLLFYFGVIICYKAENLIPNFIVFVSLLLYPPLNIQRGHMSLSNLIITCEAIHSVSTIA